MYDVIVIGAGPAGSTAAKTLADRGYKTLLLEKFKMPRYKSCSGVLIKKTMDLVSKYFGKNVPESVMCLPNENCGMVFTDDKGRTFKFEQEGLNVWRSSFDAWLAMSSQESGAELWDNTSVLSCKEEKDCVLVNLRGENEYTERAKYVLDCEGAVGAVKRKITGFGTEYITTYQTFNDGSVDLDPHYFYAYLQPELSEYDAWFNVKDNKLVLGVSVKDVSKIKSFYDRFISYMQNNHALKIENQTKEEKWIMPYIKPGCNIDFGVGKVLFAGETAGFLNPMGEGISAGMESGYCAACAVSDNFNDLDKVYLQYKKETETLRGYMTRQWSLVANMTDKFSCMKST